MGVLVVRTPNSLVAKLAEKRKEICPQLLVSPNTKSDQEKTELKKKFKEKYQHQERLPEKILHMALESVFYEEQHAEQLIGKLLEDEVKEQTEVAPPAPLSLDDEHDKLDFEADEPEKISECEN